MWFYAVLIITIALDQGSKMIVRLQMEVGDSIEVWRGILDFTRYENSGAAFGMLQGYGRWFVPVAVVAVGFILYYRNKGHFKGKLLETGAALFAGGAIGNAIDRVLFNQVTDFIAFQYHDGILNLADYALNLAVIVIVLEMVSQWFKTRKTQAS
jgi:signal peptidase II